MTWPLALTIIFMLLSTTVENYVPGKTSLISTRIIPQ